MNHSNRDASARIRRVHALARRPLSLLAQRVRAERPYSGISLDELRIAADAVGLALRRERARSCMRHWSYDLNRHIAMKRLRDEIEAELAERSARPRA